MKVSLKFREDRSPLVRAKVPVSVLGLPFLTGVAAAAGDDPRELRLDLSTAFDAGPSLRVSYRPNDPSKPFTLAVKTGIGPFGSPVAAPMSMTAEFTLLARSGAGAGVAFSILFNPRLGDFSFKKSVRSASVAAAIAADPGDDKKALEPQISFGFHTNHGIGFRGGGGGLLSLPEEVAASSVLPLRGSAAVRFRWGIRLPAALRTGFADKDPMAMVSRLDGRLPQLVMSKISIERVAGGAAATEACDRLREQLEALRVENVAMMKAVEDARASVAAGGIGEASKRDRRDDRKKSTLVPLVVGKASAAAVELEEELKKKKAAVGAGGAVSSSGDVLLT